MFISHTKLCKQDWWTLSSLPYRRRFFVKEHQEACGFCPLLWLIMFLLFTQRAFHNKENLFTKVTRRRHTMCLTKISYLQVYHLLNEYTEKSSLLVKGLVSISFWGSKLLYFQLEQNATNETVFALKLKGHAQRIWN